MITKIFNLGNALKKENIDQYSLNWATYPIRTTLIKVMFDLSINYKYTFSHDDICLCTYK